MITQFNHIGVNVRSLPATMQFYTEHLGAKFTRGLYIPGSHTIAAYMQLGDLMIEFLSPLSPNENTQYGIAHVAYLTDDIQQETQRLKGLGYHFNVEPKRAGSGGGLLAFVADPNGASVELIERAESFFDTAWQPTTDVLGIDHASIVANDLDAAVRFYTQDMGMQMLHNFHFEERGFDMLYMNMGKGVLELLHNDKPGEGPLMGHIALLVKDSKKLADELAAKGVTILTQPRELATKNGMVCNIEDPDGIKLELIDRVSLFDF